MAKKKAKDFTDLTHSPIARTKDAKQNFPEILKKHLGIVSKACAEAGISRVAYYKWREIDSNFAELCDEAQEYTGDIVENVLYDLIIEEKNPQATMFYCKTKLRNRGFIERKEVDNTHTFKHENALKEMIDE